MVEGAQATEGRGQTLFDVADGLADPFAEVTLAVTVAQFMGLMGTGAGAAGHDGAAAGTAFQQYFGFNGGGATGIQHLPGHHGVDHEVQGIEHVGALRTGALCRSGLHNDRSARHC